MKRMIIGLLAFGSISTFANTTYECEVAIDSTIVSKNIQVEFNEIFGATVYEFKDGSTLSIVPNDYNWAQGRDFGNDGLRMRYKVVSPSIDADYVVAESYSPSREGVGIYIKHIIGNTLTSRCFLK
jgi:hypothetical protein